MASLTSLDGQTGDAESLQEIRQESRPLPVPRPGVVPEMVALSSNLEMVSIVLTR